MPYGEHKASEGCLPFSPCSLPLPLIIHTEKKKSVLIPITCKAISLSHGRYFRQFWGTATFTSVRAYTLQDATVYSCSYLYSGNFIISTVKSRYSHCFNCLKLFNEDRQYPKKYSKADIRPHFVDWLFKNEGETGCSSAE